MLHERPEQLDRECLEIAAGQRRAEQRVTGRERIVAAEDAHDRLVLRFAGLAERVSARAAGPADDFWSWRDRMYRVALRITPDQLRAIVRASRLGCG